MAPDNGIRRYLNAAMLFFYPVAALELIAGIWLVVIGPGRPETVSTP